MHSLPKRGAGRNGAEYHSRSAAANDAPLYGASKNQNTLRP